MEDRLSRTQRIGYALGSLGTGGFATVPGLLLLFYLTDYLGIAAGVAGLIVAGPKVWDVVIAPILGSLSDRTMLRQGTRRPWLLLGALTLPALFAVMFAVPTDFVGGPGAGVWVAVLFTFAVTAFAAYQVSYLAMPAEITDSYSERTRVMAWRIVFLTLAILVFGAGAPLLVEWAGGGLGGYRTMAAIVAFGLFAAMLASWFMTRGTQAYSPPQSEPTMRERFTALGQNREFVTLLGAFVLQALATGSMLASAPYVARYILGDSALTTILFVCLVAPAVLVMPAWSALAKRFGKQRGFVAATLIFLAATLGLVLQRGLPNAVIFALVALVGVAYAGMQMFPLAMMPDTLAADAARFGTQRAGLFTGIWTAGETAGLAIGPGLVGTVLGLAGFVSSTDTATTLAQPGSALTGIVLAFSLLPACLAAISLPLVLRYDLTEGRLDEIIHTREEAAA